MFGFHVNREWTKGDLSRQVEAARAFFDEKAERISARGFAFQVFLAGPRAMKFNVDCDEAARMRASLERAAERGAFCWGVTHGTYLDTPWNTAKPNFRWRCKFIRSEVKMAAAAGLAGVVIHLNTYPPEEIAQVLPFLVPAAYSREEEEEKPPVDDPRRAPGTCHFLVRGSRRPGWDEGRPDCVRVYLETPSVKPQNSHYETPEKLARLFDLVRERADPDLRFFGLCIDTAHIWASGVDISSREAAEDWLARLEACSASIPPEAIMFHLNDNRNARGSGRDEHDPLFMGAIWGEYAQEPGKSGLAAFLEFANRHDIPTVLERKGRKAGNEHSEAELTAEEALTEDLGRIEQLA